MHQCQPQDFEYFYDYFDEVIHEAWLHIIAVDPRVDRGSSLRMFSVSSNIDRSIAANYIARVAEENKLKSEDMKQIFTHHKVQLATNYE